MQSHHKYLAAVTAMAVTAAVTMASLRRQETQPGTRPPAHRKTLRPDEDQWPVAADQNAEPLNERQRAKREAKGNRYNRSLFGVKGAVKSAHENITVVLTEDWEADVPALPVAQSSAVVIGTVLDAKGFMSTDQTGVYSEFPTRVDEVLKNDGVPRLDAGSVITVERGGGRVRGPSAVVVFRVRGQNMPRLGRRYVMFLRWLEGVEDYRVVTAYELREGKVHPLDSSDKFAPYATWDEATFLQTLRDAMSRP